MISFEEIDDTLASSEKENQLSSRLGQGIEINFVPWNYLLFQENKIELSNSGILRQVLIEYIRIFKVSVLQAVSR